MIAILLAPVPCVHIDDALAVPGSSVAFGSGTPGEETSGVRAWEFFQRLDAEGEEGRLAVCIYASRTGREQAPHRYVGEVISLIGRYGGSVPAVGRGRHPNPSVRPSSARETDGRWSVFWHVDGLRALPREAYIPLHALRTAVAGTPSQTAPGIPRGPIRAFAPDVLSRLLD